MTDDTLLAIDQGTSSSRGIVFSVSGEIISVGQQPFEQIYPASGWVEHDAEVIWATTLSTARQALRKAGSARAPKAIGITNQRETTVVWDRRTGAPIHNAIVWQDRRTAQICRDLEAKGHEAIVAERSGLRLDPYFSATKLAWILDHVDGARAAAEAGDLAFGTVDSFLIWRLTGGKVHATDATNASRTALYDIRKGRWDEDLCALFGVPMGVLPEVRDSAGDFGVTDASVLGVELPIRGVAGDQQAALVGQACFAAGDVKSTYGTGAFLVLNTGEELVRSQNRLLTTIAYQVGGKATYALEGSILSAGSTIQWLRDGLGLFSRAPEVESLARSVSDAGGVYLLPAFTGLGAPYWDPDARGAIVGLTRASGRAEIARAGLDSAVYQTRDLLDAMAADGVAPARLRVDGGMAENGFFLQRLADILDLTVIRPKVTETTAFGAAALAGLGAGLFSSLDDIAGLWKADVECGPKMKAEARDAEIAGWREALARVRTS
ncbi:glycerol kinase GlpK [Caulobacter segnis]|uniref:glycerol kinase GlpK n=1 Tax=Caulobacter segnis TaxID=88688 RepID=UPI00240ED885|nr:glycerol kinase GlpK [Caulobacter segnis]MDG2523429.1 glycerol kinase GlpK [Caulobacter segnis]